jgi:ElaB/YqjD/DUF883 family membrane-anchored ribosome-binding protein
MANATTRRTKDTAKKIKRESKEIGRDLRRTASRAKMAARDSATYEANRNFKDAVKEDARRIKNKYSEKMSDAEMFVIDHPMKAVGIAAGIGAMIGLILGASMASKAREYEDYRRRWDRDY